MSQVPIARGLAVCENVIIEERSHNLTLVNCFTVKRSPTFPASSIRFAVAAFLSDGDGDINMTVAVHRLDTMARVYAYSNYVRFSDRMQEVRFLLRIDRCPFPVPGDYQVSLLAEGEPIAQQRIRIDAFEEPS